MKKPLLTITAFAAILVVAAILVSPINPFRKKCDCPIPVFSNQLTALDYNKDTAEIRCKIYTNINKYLKESLKDYSSYQPISFAEFEWIKPEKANKISVYLSDHGFYDDSVKVKEKGLDSLWAVYNKLKPIGYTIKHKYRAKNGFGAYGLSVEEFRLDTLFNVMYSKESSYMEDRFKSLQSRYDNLKNQ